MDYGRAIRTIRTAKSISQKELSKLTGLSGNYISMIESGRRIPSTVALEALSCAMGVPILLIALLGSDAEDLRGIPVENARLLAQELLGILINDEQRGDAARARKA
jgi:transcriptional regulator with XRE-family HTH domain